MLWQIWVGAWWLTVQLSSFQIRKQYNVALCITTTTQLQYTCAHV